MIEPSGLLTMAEAAAMFGKSVRWLQNWLRDHPFDPDGIRTSASSEEPSCFAIKTLIEFSKPT